MGGVSVSRMISGQMSKQAFFHPLPKLLQKPEIRGHRVAPGNRHCHPGKALRGVLSFLFPIPALIQPTISQLRKL
jgi:hypothetical protein